MLSNLKKLPINRYLDLLVLVFLLTFPLYQKTYWVYVMSGIMAYIIFALSLDLLWGYTGLMSMGHSVLFGAGGYMIGIASATMNQANWIQFERLPWFLSPLGTEAGAFLMALLVPAAIALFIGAFHVHGQNTGRVLFADHAGHRGHRRAVRQKPEPVHPRRQRDNGRFPHDRIQRQGHADDGPAILLRRACVSWPYATLVCLLLIASRTGKVLQSVRENEARLTFLGYRPAVFKLFVFVVSGMMAGLAGVLYVRVQGSINYTSVGIGTSTWCWCGWPWAGAAI